MKRRLPAVLGILLLASACAESDADTTAKVKSQLATDRSITAASHIEVSTHKKVVTLTGTAESVIVRERASAVARATDGVDNVHNNLTVVPAQAEVAANSAAQAAPAAAGDPNDATITSTIQAKLAQDRRVAGAKIEVETRLGIVTLSGTVSSDQIKRDALQIAQDTAGVQRVEDQLVVKSS